MTSEDAAALQRAFRTRRRLWARKIGLPYSDDIERPDPGVHDLAAEDDG